MKTKDSESGSQLLLKHCDRKFSDGPFEMVGMLLPSQQQVRIPYLRHGFGIAE